MNKLKEKFIIIFISIFLLIFLGCNDDNNITEELEDQIKEDDSSEQTVVYEPIQIVPEPSDAPPLGEGDAPEPTKDLAEPKDVPEPTNAPPLE